MTKSNMEKSNMEKSNMTKSNMTKSNVAKSIAKSTIIKSKKSSKVTELTGGLDTKNDPDKLDKDDYESVKRDDDELIEDIEEEKEDDEEEEEEVEEVEQEGEEKEVFDKEADEEVTDGDDECLYKITKKKNTIDIDLEEPEDNFDDEDDNTNKKSIYVKPEDRITKSFLFEYERVRILGERAKQLSLGAKPMIKNIENYDPKIIAKMELQNKVLPLIILRELPDGRIEKWKVSELSY